MWSGCQSDVSDVVLGGDQVVVMDVVCGVSESVCWRSGWNREEEE